MMDFLEEIVGKMTRRAEALPDLDRYAAALDGGMAALAEAMASTPPADQAFIRRKRKARAEVHRPGP